MEKITMTFKKSTKNTHVYVDEVESSPIPQLYIMREALPKDVPQRIRITVEIE